MTQATGITHARTRAETRFVASISAAHFVSHYYLLILPPLFEVIRTDYGVSYTELGLALVAFNVVSTLLQIPAGFVVDRLGARALLIGALLLGATAFALAGLIHSFWLFVAMFGLAGVGNTIYHPADYALLSHHVPAERVAGAFSIHTFAGMLGAAAAPVTLLFLQGIWGWRGAFICAAMLGFAAAAVLLVQREGPPVAPTAKATDQHAGHSGWRLLLSTPILVNLVFFMLLALMNGGLQNYSVVALTALHGTPAPVANTALTGYLVLAAVGVLAGGFFAARTVRHGLVAVAGALGIAAMAALVGIADLPDILLFTAMSLGGFFTGVIMPSRDMIVRAITPRGSFGTVFGFVSTGFNIGGTIAPLIFGVAMDHGSPRSVFLLVAVFSLIAVLTVTGSRSRVA